VGYSQTRGRKPFERASKIAHASVINNPTVRAFIAKCELPAAPATESLAAMLQPLPPPTGNIHSIIAIDGGLAETFVRAELPSASIAFATMGPVLLELDTLAGLDSQAFIGPEDMSRLKSVQRYSLALPTRGVRVAGCATFSEGVRRTIQDFLLVGDGHLMRALQWLLFRGWLPAAAQSRWQLPRCPNQGCAGEKIEFGPGTPLEFTCQQCHRPVFLADGLRLYERIDDEQGAGSILAYLLTALEQIVLVHIIRTLFELKKGFLKEFLLVKDGPLAFFGVTAPLYRPVRDLMSFLGGGTAEPMINLIGLEKSGPFVEHAALLEPHIPPGQVLLLSNDYIYKHIVPGDPKTNIFGQNTYYGAKLIFRSNRGDTYVATVPTGGESTASHVQEVYNLGEVLDVTGRLRCSMYDNALLPIVLANRLVSLAHVPSAEILARFAKKTIA
jgi:hypothetical protein